MKHIVEWMEEVKNDTRNIGVIEEVTLGRGGRQAKGRKRKIAGTSTSNIYVLVNIGEKVEKHWERLKS